MKIATGRVLDRLAAEEPCLGALFTSYGFDPAFFEEHVLRAVLRLTSDPVEQAERYHHEARRALQETPVVAIVDAAERRPGRRLPFDLLEVLDTVFHPKSSLLLYRDFARLVIGSGNLTFGGYGGNAELFLCLDLAYDEDEDAALLVAFDEHLDRMRALVKRTGTQFDLFREELRRRLPPALPDVRAASYALLDSSVAPIIDQVAALLPKTAVIESIGMLAPFFERDDASELDVTSVFGALAPRATRDAVLDVGVAWDNPQVHASGDTELEDGLGRLWTWERESDGVRLLEHLVPRSLGPNTISFVDEDGRGRRRPLDEAREAVSTRRLWMQPPPIAFAPRHAVAAAGERFAELRLWLHPATRLVGGRPLHRPLHAKLLVIGFRAGRSQSTLVVMGSPNMSRRALLMRAGVGAGNVEVAVAFRLRGRATLRDFVPELVYAPTTVVELKERDFPELGHNYARAIDEAVHDPKARTLVVSWSSEADALHEWRLTYDGELIAASTSPPTSPVTVEDFSLRPASAEVVLHVEGQDFPVPILVTDLVALPATPAGPGIGLEELLMLLGRRIGTERALQVATSRARAGESSALDAFFGEGFGPTNVFRAWWSVAEELKDATLSVQAFRLRLEGALGVGAAWSAMRACVAADTLAPEEAWFYGAELLRELGAIEHPPRRDGDAKRGLLSAFTEGLRRDLAALSPGAAARPWVRRIFDFYGVSER